MKKSILIIAILSIITFSQQSLNAQKLDISFEEIEAMCDGSIPREDRIRVTVVRFSSRMHSRHNDLGIELASMLTNALQEINCFRVLESAQRISDFDAEYTLADQGYTNSNAPERGKMLGAQAIITGEITEYAEGGKNVNISGLSFGKNKANVGFILKVMHPETREVLFSKSVNMEGKASGFSGLSAGRFKIAGSEDRSKALNNAVEKAIIKAAEVLTSSKDGWGIQADNGKPGSGNRSIQVVVENINYMGMVSLEKKLISIPGVQDVRKNFSGSTGTFSGSYQGSVDDLAVAIYDKVGNRLKINAVDTDSGTLRLTHQ